MAYSTIIVQMDENPLILVVDESKLSLTDFIKIESKLYTDAISNNLKVFGSYANGSKNNDFLIIGLN